MTDLALSSTHAQLGAPADVAVIRCSLGTVAEYPDYPAEWGDLDAIALLWSADAIREAVLIASPGLASQVDKLLESSAADTPARKRRRLHKGLLKYALRLSSRCTPFGAFAGVAVLAVGDVEPLLGPSHIRHVRASGAVTRRLVRLARTMPQVRLYPNPALMERADRMVVRVMRGSNDTHTQSSIRATGPARLAVAACSGTATRQDVERQVAAAYPTAGRTKVRELIDQLLAAEVLLCEAEHSAFDSDPLVRLPDAVEGVVEMRAAVAKYSDASDPAKDGSLDELLHLSFVGGVQRDIHVDLELDVSGQIPTLVVDAARNAVTALAPTMGHLPMNSGLNEFADEFAERYGRTLVPFLTAIDEELGIGYPRAYEAVAQRRPAITNEEDPDVERRRALIGRLLQQAAADRLDAVELTDADLAGFSEPSGLPSTLDVILKLRREPLGLRASIIGMGFPGGSAVGRFTAVMPRAYDFARRCVEIDSAWWADSTGGRGILCGVDYIAGSDSINEVSTTAPLYPMTLAVNARPPKSAGAVLTLADVYLGFAEGRMRTVLADGTPLSFRQLTMATTRASAKAVRLLRDISDAGIQRPFWSWGEAESIMNCLPEVRYKGVTLTEQRWRFPASADRSKVALKEWITTTGISRYVLVGPYDNQLHLDTRHPRHLDLLLDEIIDGSQWLYRAPEPEQTGVIRDHRSAMHAAEVAVTVAAPGTRRGEPDLLGWPLHDPSDDEQRLLVPGGAWTAFAIDAASNSHDRVLRAFADDFPDLVGDWYFVRYRQNDQDQLRLRVRRPVVELAGVLAWLAEARLAGRIGDYTIPVYHRELERYGGPRSFQVYERLFCRESAHIVAMLPILDSMSLPATDTPRLVRSGIEAAAGILAQWLDGLDPNRVSANEVVGATIDHYGGELGSVVHKIKTELRQRQPGVDEGNGLVADMRSFWEHPAHSAAVMTPGVLQSASHMFCNRLGLRRHEEFAAMWLVKTDRNRKARRGARHR